MKKRNVISLILSLVFIGLVPSFIAIYASVNYDPCWEGTVISSKTWLIVYGIVNLPFIFILTPLFIIDMNRNYSQGKHWIYHVVFTIWLIWNFIWLIVGSIAIANNNLEDCKDYPYAAIIISMLFQSIDLLLSFCANFAIWFF